MKQKFNIDELVRRYFKPRQYEYKEAYWQQMEQLLAHQPSRRRPWLWLLTSSMLLLTVITATFYWINKSGVNGEEITVSALQIAPTTEYLKAFSHNAHQKTFDSNLDNASDTDYITNFAGKDNASKPSGYSNNENKNIGSRPKVQDTREYSEAENTVDKRNDFEPENKTGSVENNSENKGWGYSSLQNAVGESDLDFLPFQKYELQFSNLFPSKTVLPKSQENQKKYKLWLTAALHLQSQNDLINSADASAGFLYEYPFTSRISVSSGLAFRMDRGMNLTRKSTSIIYDFTSETTVTTVSALEFYYISIPLYAQIYISPRQAIRAGVSGGYLINTRSEVEQITQPQLEASISKINKEWGYKYPGKVWDIRTSLGYVLRIDERWAIGGDAEYSFIKPEDPNELSLKDQLYFGFYLKYKIK